MASKQLENRIELFNQDAESFSGTKPKTFLCPIRLIDSPGEIIKGHVTSQTLAKCSGHWVPQRSDVDGVFGTIEGEFHKAFAARCSDPVALLGDPKAYKQVRPTLELDGIALRHFFPGNSEVVAMVPEPLVGDKEQLDVDVVIDRDDRGVALMAAMHAAHLTMFYLMGYSYVFGVGRSLAVILNDYFERGVNLCRKERAELASEFLAEFVWMHAPLQGGFAHDLMGTVQDRRFLVAETERGKIFACGVVVRFNEERLVVFLPSSDAKDPHYVELLSGKLPRLRIRDARMVGEGLLAVERIEVSGGDAAILQFTDAPPEYDAS